MQSVTSAFNSIFAKGKYMLNVEYRMTVNGSTVYGQDTLVESEGVLTESLFGKFSIGNFVSKELDISFVNDAVEVPKGASLFIECRISADKKTWSEWIPKGTFFVDTRRVRQGVTTVHAYDSAMKANAVFMRTGTWQTIKALALYQEICTMIGVSTDSLTVATMTANNYDITKAPSIGENGTKILEMLMYLGTLYGGNWAVDETNHLKLISTKQSSYYECDANEDLELAKNSVTVDRVEIFTDASGQDVVRYPNVSTARWNAMTGYILQGQSIYVDKNNVVDVYNRVVGSTYRGFSASAVSENPALQIGDGIQLEGVNLVLVKRVLTFGVDMPEYSAPYEEELESEYPTISPQIRKLQRAIEVSGASLNVLNNKIDAEVVNRQNGEVKSVVRQYCLSDSTFVPAHHTEWSEVMPTPTEGWYLWSRMYITYNDDTYKTTEPVLGENALYQDVLENRANIEINADNIKSEVTRINAEMGENLAPLTSMQTDDLTYWKVNVNPAMVTNLADGWMHVEGVGAESRALFIPLARAISYDSLTLMVEIRNATYTSGTVLIQHTGYAGTKPQYIPKGSLTNPANGAHYIQLVPNPDTDNTSSLFNIMIWRLNSAEFSFDIRFSLYAGNHTGDFIPYSIYSQSSRVTQTADGILIDLATKITADEAQGLVDAYGDGVRKYLEYVDGVLRLGENSSQFKALLSNTRLVFTGADGKECAWISNNQLYINESVLNGPMYIRKNAQSSTGWRVFVDSNDMLIFRHVTGLEVSNGN